MEKRDRKKKSKDRQSQQGADMSSAYVSQPGTST